MLSACAKLSTGPVKMFLALAALQAGLVHGESRSDPGSNAARADRLTQRTPIVIAHRGASGHRPEHTLAAYRYALMQDADFIEVDLVVTHDGELIARHENLLAEVALTEQGEIERDALGEPIVLQATTDVADHDEFGARLTVKRIDGRLHGGWFSEDFTLADIKKLRARERLPGLRGLNRLYDDVYQIPSLTEIIALVAQQNVPGNAPGKAAGLYIEIKHPTYFLHEGRHLDGSRISVDPGAALLETLIADEFTAPDLLYLQSFEVDSLLALNRQMAQAGLDIPLVQLFGDVSNEFYIARPYDMVYHAQTGEDLRARYGGLVDLIEGGIGPEVSYAQLATPAVIEFMAAGYARGIGPPKQNVLLTRTGAPQDADGDGRALQRAELTGGIGELVKSARAAGLEVHPYTLRIEEPFLVRDEYHVLPMAEEAERLLDAGASGFFTDQPAEGRAAVIAYRKHNQAHQTRQAR